MTTLGICISRAKTYLNRTQSQGLSPNFQPCFRCVIIPVVFWMMTWLALLNFLLIVCFLMMGNIFLLFLLFWLLGLRLLLLLLIHFHFRIQGLHHWDFNCFLISRYQVLIWILFILNELECFRSRFSFLNFYLMISKKFILYIKIYFLLRILLLKQVVEFFQISLILKRNSCLMITFLSRGFSFFIYQIYLYYSLKNYFLTM